MEEETLNSSLREYYVDQPLKKIKKMEELEKIHHDHDLISDLPESLIIKITSLLSLEDAIRFSFTSKKFFSAFKSIPVLDFNFDSFTKSSKKFKSYQIISFFPDFVAKSLELLTHYHSDTCFPRLSFVSPLTSDVLASKMVDFSLVNKVKELNLTNERVYPLSKEIQVCNLQNTIFSAQHLTRLKINGFNLKLEASNLVLSCPLIEDVDLNYCTGLETISLLGDKLKHVVLNSCPQLVKISIDPQARLESFSYSAYFRYKCAVEEDAVCCATCWRHFLVEVEMENFGESKERSDLHNFLTRNAKGLTNIICNSC
ncbi:hypothetical protein FEM48_ZijujUnG0073800 [Ziziphus jujuba var. spinosa]|uniref:F-box domain-containing protein n=1 Tax=Ziziphus jujuba var. spinosa TaxID=714518 RepID=A0A978U8U1_ZIZJJ|nr:hypothetical protein FEM48_ZijujUnG0073800 [Ziziphus jujuba var. spinosa]